MSLDRAAARPHDFPEDSGWRPAHSASPRGETENVMLTRSVGELTLKGFSCPSPLPTACD